MEPLNPDRRDYFRFRIDLGQVQLLRISGCLTKEYYMGIYLVTKWIRMMSRKAGWLSTALYLKCCAVALMRVREVSLIKTDLTPESDSPNQRRLA